MKNLNLKTVASIALVGMMSIGTVNAASVVEGQVSEIPSVTDSGSLKVNLENGVATVYGDVETLADSIETKKHVQSLEGVDRVINRLNINWANSAR